MQRANGRKVMIFYTIFIGELKVRKKSTSSETTRKT